ncbi:MAG: prepilin-type N-terminal cleavage/methylation domain-containing protein [Myxococcaceae bacterium]|nr:prepilin-type N-terminal cleavage/methylation domain-containing protein [Myxococcaceae bacterium]
MRRARSQRGFTLLEAAVAMSMLATSLVGLYYINYGAMQNHAYSKQLTVASLLARSKMVDLEQHLYDDGMQLDDEELDGDFEEEGWPSFKWRATIIAPKTDGLPPEQLLPALFNMPVGAGTGEGGKDGTQDPLSAMASLFLGSMGAGGVDASAAGAGAGALGGMSGLMQTQLNQLVDQITKTVREVHLTVYWKDGKNVESFDVVTHVVSMGPGSDRNGGAGLGNQAADQAAGQSQWVDSVTGVPVPNPVPKPGGGGLVNPQTGNPVIKLDQWLQQHGSTPGALPGGIPGMPNRSTVLNPFGQVRPMFNRNTTVTP